MTTGKTALKTLLDTTFDSVAGYRKAAETANDPELKAILTNQATQREAVAQRLNAELTRLGGDLVTSGTAAGSLHRLWLDVTDLFRSGDKAAIARVEEGEDYLAKKFETALEHADLEPQTRAVLTAAYADIREGERLADRLEARFNA